MGGLNSHIFIFVGGKNEKLPFPAKTSDFQSDCPPPPPPTKVKIAIYSHNFKILKVIVTISSQELRFWKWQFTHDEKLLLSDWTSDVQSDSLPSPQWKFPISI